MNWLKKLFGYEHKQRSLFTVEYYPITDRYYPKYKNNYMKRNYYTGIIQLIDDFLFTYAKYGRTMEQAKEIIKEFKEQQLKENVKTFKV